MSTATPRDVALFDAGAAWATAATNRLEHDDALRQAVARATTPTDPAEGSDLAALVVDAFADARAIRSAGVCLMVDFRDGSSADVYDVVRVALATPAAPGQRITVTLPEADGVERNGFLHWRVHDDAGDDEFGAEGETWNIQVDVDGTVLLDGNPITMPDAVAKAILAAYVWVRSRSDAPSNIAPSPESGSL